MADNWKDALQRIIESWGLDGSVTCIDVISGEQWCWNDRPQTLAASLIKLPLLWDLFARSEANEISLNEEIVLSNEHRVDGGLLHRFSSCPVLRLEDLALLAAAVSDNSATNLLIDRLGMEQIQHRIESLGMASTQLERKMLDSKAKAQGLENRTSARDVAALLTRFVEPGEEGLSSQSRRRILEMLSCQKLQNKLAARIPCDDVDDMEQILAHKTGELPGCEHDCGIFFPFGLRPVVCAVLTRNLKNRLDGVALCAELGRAVYDYWLPLQNQ